MTPAATEGARYRKTFRDKVRWSQIDNLCCQRRVHMATASGGDREVARAYMGGSFPLLLHTPLASERLPDHELQCGLHLPWQREQAFASRHRGKRRGEGSPRRPHCPQRYGNVRYCTAPVPDRTVWYTYRTVPYGTEQKT